MAAHESQLLVCAFDDRYRLPQYFDPFIRHATRFSQLHLITPARRLVSGTPIASLASSFPLISHNPDHDIFYQASLSALELLFTNLSTNPKHFELPCFARWFAFNSVATELDDDAYIFMLDTDVLLLLPPQDFVRAIMDVAAESSFDAVACWSTVGPIPIVTPALMVIRKSVLRDFCKFLLTFYLARINQPLLMADFFDQIGRGFRGGISDMTAWSSFFAQSESTCINFSTIQGIAIVDHMNRFLASCRESIEPVIEYNNGRFGLIKDGFSTPLGAIHFQGGAKRLIPLFDSVLSSDRHRTLSYQEIIDYLAALPVSRPNPITLIKQRVITRWSIFKKSGYLVI